MTMDYYERRKIRIGDFEYLLDDEDKTAWISEGHSGGERVYYEIITPESSRL